MARPSIPYDPEIGEEICERIAESEDGLETIIEKMRLTFGDRVPSIRVIYRWLESSEEFRQHSARARTLQADLLHDRAQRYARQALIGVIRKEERSGADDPKVTVTETRSDNVERAKLLVQTTLKRAGQLNPKKYGERVQQEHTGELGIRTILVSASAKSEEKRPERKPEFEAE